MLRFFYVILMNLKRAPYLVSLMRKMIKNPERYDEETRYNLAKRLINYMKASGQITTEVYGADHLPSKGGYVMFPNHQGKYDALGIIYAHEKPCTFVMDKAKSYGFLVRELVDLLGAKRIVLNNPRQGLKIINQMAEEVMQGRRYIIFSEGGYHKNHNHVQEFKPGSFKSAVKAKAPIVPVCLIDSYKPFNSLEMGKLTTKVIFLEPLYYEDYKEMRTPEIAEKVKTAIVQCMKDFNICTD